MEKRSPKSPVLYERYKSGCAWSSIKFFDFGHGDSNRKLISDRKGLNSDELDMKNRIHLLSNSGGKCECIDDGVNRKSRRIDSSQADVTRMKEGEMATELQVKKKIADSKGQHVNSSDTPTVGQFRTNHKRKASKTFQIHGCKDIATLGPRQPSHQNSVDKSSKSLNKATMTEGSSSQAHIKNGTDCRCRSVGHQESNQLSEINLQVKMNEAAEAFINQKFIEGKLLGKKKAGHQTQHFLDALEILNSNKELFISLLQDPNSLLVKHIQDLRQSHASSQETKSSLSENYRTTVGESTKHGCNQNSCDRCSTEGSFDPQSSERIVVLKPGSSAGDISDCSSSQSLYSSRNRVQSAKPAHLSFGHMKRKLTHAIGLSRKQKNTSTDCARHESLCDVQGLGVGGKGKGKEIRDNISLTESKLANGEMEKSSSLKRRDKLDKLMDSGSGIKEEVVINGGSGHENSTLSVVRHLQQSESNVYLQTRERLSEISKNLDVDSSRKQVRIDCGRIVYLPEYDLLAALRLGRHRDQGFNAAQMRFSPYGYYQMVNEKKYQLQKEKKNSYFSPARQITKVPSLADYKKFTDQLQIFDKKPNDSENHFSNIQRLESVYSLSDTSRYRGSVSNTANCGEICSWRVPLEPHQLHNNGGSENTGPANTYEGNEHMECSILDSPPENCTSPSSEDAYSSSPLSIKMPEDSDSLKDKAEHASPVSVLEQYSIEDISPLSTTSQSAEPAVEPKQDNYEENNSTALLTSPQALKNYSSKAMDEHESMSKYITSVLQACGIKWEELSIKCHSSDHQLLEPSLLDEVELLPNQLTVDHKLLFDYINEVLLEMYHCYFCCTPWVPFLKPKFQTVRSGANLVNEVMKCVDLDILLHKQFQTLQQLVERDLAKSRTWMDTRIDTEVAVTELVESVIQELALEISMDLHI